MSVWHDKNEKPDGEIIWEYYDKDDNLQDKNTCIFKTITTFDFNSLMDLECFEKYTFRWMYYSDFLKLLKEQDNG